MIIFLYTIQDMQKSLMRRQGRTEALLERNENKEVAVLLGAGSMGMAILRRVEAGKRILLGSRRQSSLDRAAESLRYSGYDVETFVLDAVDPVR